MHPRFHILRHLLITSQNCWLPVQMIINVITNRNIISKQNNNAQEPEFTNGNQQTLPELTWHIFRVSGPSCDQQMRSQCSHVPPPSNSSTIHIGGVEDDWCWAVSIPCLHGEQGFVACRSLDQSTTSDQWSRSLQRRYCSSIKTHMTQLHMADFTGESPSFFVRSYSPSNANRIQLYACKQF